MPTSRVERHKQVVRQMLLPALAWESRRLLEMPTSRVERHKQVVRHMFAIADLAA